MPPANKELIVWVNTLTADEVVAFISVIKISNRIMWLLGVGSILSVLAYVSAYVAIPAAIVTIMTARISSRLDQISRMLSERLVWPNDK